MSEAIALADSPAALSGRLPNTAAALRGLAIGIALFLFTAIAGLLFAAAVFGYPGGLA